MTSIQSYLDEMKAIQGDLLNFLDSEFDDAKNFLELKINLEDFKNRNDKHEFKSLLHLIIKITNNYHHTPSFYDKIITILKFFKDDIKKNFSNSEIFNIFKSNKRLLLFLVEEKIMIIDKFIIQKMFAEKYMTFYYPDYFSPEIISFGKENKEWVKKHEDDLDIYEILNQKITEDFYENRKNGENDSYICKLIREDSVEEFISYINKNNISFKKEINQSIFETNLYLIEQINNSGLFNSNNNKLTLVEYAVFFGSIEIFQYLIMNGVELKPILWIYAIHGKNAQIIHLLEENHIEPEGKNYKKCLIESIKCHHNDIANYILNNYIKNENEFSNEIFICALKYYNFSFIEEKFVDNSSFNHLVNYDYYPLVYFLFIKGNYKADKSSNKTAFYHAVEKENIDILKLLLTSDIIDFNTPYILIIKVF